MTTPDDLQKRFWKALASDRTLMLGLDGVEDGHVRPMTGLVDGEHGPIWFFTSSDNDLVRLLPQGDRAIAAFTSKGHELFATVHGRLSLEDDRGVVDRLWNPIIAAWYPEGKTDPTLRLLRLDGERAEIWQNESSVFAGIRLLLGADPRESYRDKVAEVPLAR